MPCWRWRSCRGITRYRDWILPLLQLPLWEEVQVIASERLSCCLSRNVAGAFDGAYISPALSERWGREVRVLYDLKTLSAHGRPYSTAAQLGGYMVLEAAQGNHYELGQTIWSKPGEAFPAPSTAVSSAWRPGPPPGAATAWPTDPSEPQPAPIRN